MKYEQETTIARSTQEKAGRCLQFTQSYLGVPHLYDSAWQAYESTQFKHNDRNFPAGVAVPIWFDWTGTVLWSDGVYRTARYGHAAVHDKDGKIHSSPGIGHGQQVFNSVDELIAYFGGGMKFVAWSDDISGIRVIKEDDMSETTRDIDRILAYAVGGRNGFDGRSNALTGKNDAELKKNHEGKETNAEITAWYTSAEGKKWREVTLPGVYADRDKYKKALADANAKIVELQKHVVAVPADTSEAEKKLKNLKDAFEAVLGE